MTKSIRSYPEKEQREVVNRLLLHSQGGLGYWAAKDAEKKLKSASVKV